MSSNNKLNILYFNAKSMYWLYENMQAWQKEHNKRFLSVSIQKDDDMFCAIALTDLIEVVITSEDGEYHAVIYPDSRGCIRLRTT